ncbi:hypothetical protein K3495_g1430 [Podosphaera aphanis]|nr:hypothetical protein K3495_g1430 [Podosphaera aphanis]
MRGDFEQKIAGNDLVPLIYCRLALQDSQEQIGVKCYKYGVVVAHIFTKDDFNSKRPAAVYTGRSRRPCELRLVADSQAE